MRGCRHGGASEAATGRAPVGSSPVRPDIPVETPKVYEPNNFIFFLTTFRRVLHQVLLRMMVVLLQLFLQTTM